ncbi:MAG: hypothetical protein MJZ91_07360 [Bacteroidales bacterium]|nr:hypothetical protein [Bacteroidales bacterium]
MTKSGMLGCVLYQGRTKAASASSLLPICSHSASLRGGENHQKTAGWGEKNTALALGLWCSGLFSLQIRQ